MKLNKIIQFSGIVYISITGYGLAKSGDIRMAIVVALFLLFIFGMLRDERTIEKLKTKVQEQESALLRIEYIRNRMLEDQNE